MVRDREDPGTLPLQGLPMRLERVQRCLRSLHQRRFIYAMQEEKSFFFEQSVLVSKANRISHQEDPERNRRKVPETTTWS